MKNKFLVSCLFLTVSTSMSYAENWVTVTDMSKLKWQMAPNGLVYLRNLHEFNSEALSCCYNYWIDTNHDLGKATWSVFLAKMATGESLILGMPDITKASKVTYFGNW